MKPSDRQYTGPSQYFHNYEHDKEGRTHCLGPKSNPYVIVHDKGKHVINTPVAKGHGKTGNTQWFKFDKKIPGKGFDLASGKPIEPEEVTQKMKRPAIVNKLFELQKKEQLAKKRHLGH